MQSTRKWVAAAVFAAAAMGGASAATALIKNQPAVVDLGAAETIAGQSQISVTVSLKLRNTDQMESMLQAVYTAGGPSYRKFLTPQEFASKFGPTAATIARVTQHFQKAGLHVAQITGTHLSVSGSAAAMQAEFGVQLHAFEVAPTATTSGYRFRSPMGAVQVASDIADAVQSVDGLDTRPHFRPHLAHSMLAQSNGGLIDLPAAATPNSANPPGSLTVTDFAKHYDVNPLYHAGVDGKGVTIGIVTLASFTPSDAYAYWQALGLNFKSNRIHEVQIDGGSGPVSDVGGSLETTIDVEQSGGLSPSSKVVVYEAPNTNQGFIDAFAKAIDSNAADTISCSWGEWEFFDLAAQGNVVTDPVTGTQTSSLRAEGDLLFQAALQGQSFYVAAGDAGAYDDTDFFTPPSWPVPKGSVVLSVDDPAAQQWVTAMGGTTLAGPQTFAIPGAPNLTINIPTEQAWGWDYLIPLCTDLGFDPLSCGIYPGGGGGGVSAYVPLPFYQFGIPGIRSTAFDQTQLDYSQTPPAFVGTLPGGFPGRNVPDLSLNSDPDTGYQVYYTDDKNVFGIQTGWGGTSFAAPQFNGVTALYNQALGHRVGLINFALYDLARFGAAYNRFEAPLRDIKEGDNWHFNAHQGYDQATGLGVPDVANLLKALY
jgi:subtilase family serine protease